MEFAIQLKESGIPMTIEIQNPSSTDKDLEYSTWNPESQTVLDIIAWGDSHVDGSLGFVLETARVARVGEFAPLLFLPIFAIR